MKLTRAVAEVNHTRVDRFVLKMIAEGAKCQAAQPQLFCPRVEDNAFHLSALSVLIIHFLANLVLISISGARRLLAAFRYKVWVLPAGPGAVFLSHWVCRQFEPKNSVCVAWKFQHEKALRSAEINFDITRPHAWVFRGVGVPVTWHCIAVCIKLRLDVGETFDGVPARRFYFKLEQRRRPIDVQNMGLAGVPNSET